MEYLEAADDFKAKIGQAKAIADLLSKSYIEYLCDDNVKSVALLMMDLLNFLEEDFYTIYQNIDVVYIEED